MLRVGLVSLESSHVDAFAKLLNAEGGLDGMKVAGARVVALCPRDNPAERVRELQEAYGIQEVYRSLEEMVPHVDAAMLLARDGAVHREQAEPFLKAGKPTFVDKPFALSVADARAMIKLARRSQAPLMSCSALRFAVELEAIRAELAALGTIRHGFCSGPGELFFYGIHIAEVVHTMLGPGMEAVRNLADEQQDIMTIRWQDGKTGVLSLLREGANGFHFSLYCDQGYRCTPIQDLAFYRNTLAHFVRMCETGQEPIDLEHTLEIIKLLAAAQASREQHGAAVKLAEV